MARPNLSINWKTWKSTEVKMENGELKKKVVNVLENDALFDIGADVVGTLFPGVNVAVKLGRLAARKAIK